MSKRTFLVVFLLVVVALMILGFLSGAMGKAIFTGLSLPAILTIDSPKPHLPTSTIFHILWLPVTNTILASWITIAVLTGLFFAASRRMKLVPRGLQNFMEIFVESLLNFAVGVAGSKNGRRFFPLIATIFLFVFF